MDRLEVIKALEAKLFEIKSEAFLSCSEQYAPVLPAHALSGSKTYEVVGSRGSRVMITCSSSFLEEPFVVLRSARDGAHWRYEAIGVSQLRSLEDRLMSPLLKATQ